MVKRQKVEAQQRVEPGDCISKMAELPPGFADLIVADSPYNIGKAYDNYDDRKPHDEFMSWMRTWLNGAERVLNKHGTMWVFAPDEWVSEVDMYCRHDLGLYRRSWVVWHYTFGVANQKNFSRSHTHILYFTATKTKFTFNDDEVRVPSARQLVYNDKRQNASGKLPDNSWMLLREQLEPEMGGDRDSWMISRICGTFHERRKHSSNQIPVPLMSRIVLSCSDPGMMVLDPFVGTGSTGVACAMHDRNFLGFDISKVCIKESQARLLAVKK